ncbi:MAG: hypothetical protein HFH45_00080 [Bacilli bacterium]|nr:hypothetical protein [Bacilli bacterium]
MRKVVGCMVVFVCLVLFTPLVVNAQRGCCSSHGGVDYCGSGGKYICKDGTTSPSCTCSGGNSGNSNYSSNNSSSSSYSNNQSSRQVTPNYIYGCMDKNAYNYNAKANKDDGSCIAKKYGCMDNSAINYDASANVTDDSCKYKKTATEIKKIKFKTEYKENNEMPEGEKKTLKKGINGKKEVTYEITVDKNEKIISKNRVSEKVISEPVAEIIEVGTKQSIPVLGFVWIICVVIMFVYANGHRNDDLLLSKIYNTVGWPKILLFVIYIIFIVPVFIDIVTFGVNYLKKRIILSEK